MSVFNSLKKEDYKTGGDGLLELTDERLRSFMRKEPISSVYHVEQTPFARGKFASVRKLRHLATGAEYAAKFIRKRRRAADTTREIHHEVAVLALCAGTPRVVRLHEVYDERTEIAIVLELAAGGELQRVLDEEERLSEAAARRALRHVLEALAHLHERRVAHLDLKPQNVLLAPRAAIAGTAACADTGARRERLDPLNCDVKLCDFGISRVIEPGAQVREILGTRDYVAPEILSYEPIDLSADMWSVGVLAYVLLSGYSPFAGDTKQETYLNIAQCTLSFPEDLFNGVSEDALEFIKATLVVNPKGRLTVLECLEHPWLTGESSDELAVSVPIEVSVNATVESTEEEFTCCSEPQSILATASLPTECVSAATDSVEKENSRPVPIPLKHPHEQETSPPFPDAPSTPKVSRKSHPDSPTSVLNLCKKFQSDSYPTDLCDKEKIIETNGTSYIKGGVKLIDTSKSFDPISGNVKEKKPLNGASSNANGSTNLCACSFDSSVRPSESVFDCPQCGVQCCHLRPPGAGLPHDRAILC